MCAACHHLTYYEHKFSAGVRRRWITLLRAGIRCVVITPRPAGKTLNNNVYMATWITNTYLTPPRFRCTATFQFCHATRVQPYTLYRVVFCGYSVLTRPYTRTHLAALPDASCKPLCTSSADAPHSPCLLPAVLCAAVRPLARAFPYYKHDRRTLPCASLVCCVSCMPTGILPVAYPTSAGLPSHCFSTSYSMDRLFAYLITDTFRVAGIPEPPDNIQQPTTYVRVGG